MRERNTSPPSKTHHVSTASCLPTAPTPGLVYPSCTPFRHFLPSQAPASMSPPSAFTLCPHRQCPFPDWFLCALRGPTLTPSTMWPPAPSPLSLHYVMQLRNAFINVFFVSPPPLLECQPQEGRIFSSCSYSIPGTHRARPDWLRGHSQVGRGFLRGGLQEPWVSKDAWGWPLGS